MSLFMIKYGKKEHLKQIIDGKIRFSPSQTYIAMEKELHNKGQGDILEGKMKLKATRVQLCDFETNELKYVLPESELVIGVPDVNNMPIFCLSEYGIEYTADYIDSSNYKIKITKEMIDLIKNDFNDATHALIILEPEKFINSVLDIDSDVIHAGIRYYDYSINPLQMYMYLTTGEENVVANNTLSFTDDVKYRLLLCKDTDFSNQNEHRFIKTKEIVKEAKFYDINFNTKYLLVDIDALKHSIDVSDILNS